MAKLEAGHTDPLSSIQAYIDELNELDPSSRRFAVAALLAPKIGRVRLFRSHDNTLSAVAECAMSPSSETGGFWSALSSAAGIPHSSLESLGASPSYESGVAALAPVASIDLVADDSGSVSASIGLAPPLQGERLPTADEQGVVPAHSSSRRFAASSPAFAVSAAPAGPFLSAAGAADLLGVAKSTVTRKIEKNEVVGFRGFTNALRVPEEQFVQGEVVTGIPEVLDMFADESSGGETHADHKGAWDFLTATLYPGDAAPRPIERLKAAMRSRKSHDAVAELRRVKESLDYGDHV